MILEMWSNINVYNNITYYMADIHVVHKLWLISLPVHNLQYLRTTNVTDQPFCMFIAI